MQQQTQVDLATRLFELHEAQTTELADQTHRQPTSAYLDPVLAQQEQRILFRQLPLLLCLSCELPNPGDYIVDDFSGIPIIALRTPSGGIKAYLNMCRHRGARLKCDRGEGLSTLRCPYHAWSYKLDDGQLVNIPFETGFEDVDKSKTSLVPLPVSEQHGLVFVCPSQELAENIEQFMDPCRDDLASYALEGYHHFETRVLEPKINWKLVVDTFLETYHLSTLHRTTIAPLLHSNLNTFTPMGPHLRMVAARKTFQEMRQQPEEQWDLLIHSAIVYVLFPNTVFLMQGDHLETWRVYPGQTPNQSKMYVSLYTPEPTITDSARQHWNNNMDLLMATVLKEDFPLATNMQQDFREGHAHIVFGRNEPALQHFHKTVDRFLQQNTTSP